MIHKYKHKHMHTERHPNTQRERETQKHTDLQIHTKTETQREIYKHTHRETPRNTQTQTQKETYKHIHTHTLNPGFEGDIHGAAFKCFEKPELCLPYLGSILIHVSSGEAVYLAHGNGVPPIPTLCLESTAFLPFLTHPPQLSP